MLGNDNNTIVVWRIRFSLNAMAMTFKNSFIDLPNRLSYLHENEVIIVGATDSTILNEWNYAACSDTQ